ncbi:unnamed protein product [Onchocerca flexuosa]|uniref:Uncharacterized protein n=1 Tax=Onchocerca flexuosa TaxID=387005 RepID=A0A183I7H2_9BILA|nr:unnamed protein product [Onchocerca flexuosa]
MGTTPFRYRHPSIQPPQLKLVIRGKARRGGERRGGGGKLCPTHPPIYPNIINLPPLQIDNARETTSSPTDTRNTRTSLPLPLRVFPKKSVTTQPNGQNFLSKARQTNSTAFPTIIRTITTSFYPYVSLLPLLPLILF